MGRKPTGRPPGRPRKAPQRPAKPAPGRARGKPFPKRHEIGKATRFKPGNRANPGGIPKDLREFREQCRQRTATVLDRWDDIMSHGTERGLIETGRELLANGWGKPIARSELSGPSAPDGAATPIPVEVRERDPREMTTGERQRELARIMAALGTAPPDGTGETKA